MEDVKELTEEELSQQLAEVLETWPLYRKLEYKGNETVISLPVNISLFCAKCNGKQRWARERYIKTRVSGTSELIHKTGFGSVVYTCKNCPNNASAIVYYFKWPANNSAAGMNTFLKVGQWPALDENVPGRLRAHLDKENLDFYKKAIRLRNHSLGIAAVAYLRRVIENRINDMLDVLAEAARHDHFAAEELKEIKKVQEGRRFDDKIDYAAKLLPPRLRPEGKANPIDRLHALASEGLHSRSEEECIDIFDKCKSVFEYVFGNLQVESEDAKAFLKNLDGLNSSNAPD